jgi:sugar phosphate isomerase/epimerase
MRLAIGTHVYTVAKIPLGEALESAKRCGFKLVDIAAWDSADPTQMSSEERRNLIKRFKDLGLSSSQLLLHRTKQLTSSDTSVKTQTLEYMKKCTDFQLELGGKQVLICWGCGIYEPNMVKEQGWLNSLNTIREYSEWCLDKKILIEFELDPHVYFVVNSLEKMVKMIEDVGMPNVFANIDTGHLTINREPPKAMEKLKNRILHLHLSDTDSLKHTNPILGLGIVDFKSYVHKASELGIEENCRAHNEIATAGIEMGTSLGGEVDNAERWVREGLSYVRKILPELTL